MQTELVPPFLAQAGTAVVIIYLCLQIVKVAMQFAGKGPIAKEDHASRTEYRLDKLDEEMKERITRPEYESRNADILRQLQHMEQYTGVQLQRMESKIDGLTGIRALFTGKQDQP